MLSILIPTYNYDIQPLVYNVYEQISKLAVDFEILCYDDCSTDSDVVKGNNNINSLANTSYIVLKKNIGRSAIRNLLAKNAKFSWLLFLDADVMPKHNTFIANYLHSISQASQVIFGGIVYKENFPNGNELLRWVYGRNVESKSASVRSKTKYKSLLFSNTIVKKDVFKTTNFKEELKIYGFEDVLFAYDLLQNNISILHIENEVFHNGIDKNTQFLNKTKDALNNLKQVGQHNLIAPKFVKILNVYYTLKRLKLDFFFAKIYKQFHNTMTANLVSNRPSLKMFSLYKLSYFCFIHNLKK